MQKSAREIELKYQVDLDTFERLKLAMTPPDVSDAGWDHFWDLGYPDAVAFMRYRETPQELTIKVEDGQGVTNRVEVNLPLLSEKRMVDVFKLFDKPHFSLFKAFHVWKSKNIEISLYHATLVDGYFLEIEGLTIESCQEAINHFQVSIPGAYTLINKSLFSLAKEKEITDRPQFTSSFPKMHR